MIIDVEDLSFSYGENQVLDSINMSVREGDLLGLVGPNGSGKTTLVKILLNILTPDQGQVRLFGTSVDSFQNWDRVGYVPQKYERGTQFPATVNELLSLETKPKNGGLNVIERLEMEPFLDNRFIDLSGGQQQRVMVGIALRKNPDLLILDEPSVGVDVRVESRFHNLLNRLNNEDNLTILLISHDVGMISEQTNRVVVLNQSICCEGETEDLPELLKVAYGDEYRLLQHMHGPPEEKQ